MARLAAPLRSRLHPGARLTTGIRSRAVRKLVKVETRAARLRARYERTLSCAAPLLQRAETLRRRVRAMELMLNATESGELRRFRSTTTQ